MELSEGERVLRPDYEKTMLEVYRDSVEAALLTFKKTDVMLYVTGKEDPSWIPRWDVEMLFRNPFRFAKALPWKPSGNSQPIWEIDKSSKVLSLTGYAHDVVEYVEPYYESQFGNAMLDDEEGRAKLREVWRRLLSLVEGSGVEVPFSRVTAQAMAVAFSYGLNQNSDPADEHLLLLNFLAYLRLVLDPEDYSRNIPTELHTLAVQGDQFGTSSTRSQRSLSPGVS